MRVAIIGASGQLGDALVRAAQARGATPLPLDHARIEVADPTSVDAALLPLQADLVVNCAALHKVDACEQRPEEAYRVNALGALHVARAAHRAGARPVYVSTDFVFDGGRTSPYHEEDLPRPLNVYGASKLAGEHATRLAAPDALIVRTSGIYGAAVARGKGSTFVETILRKAAEGGPLRVVADQRMTCAYAEDVARAILDLARVGASGTVHVVNEGSLTWHELASHAVELAGLRARVEPLRLADLPPGPARPAQSALDTTKLAKLLGSPLRSWRDALAAYMARRTS